MTKPFYITTAIDYANGDPHLGHALEKVGADVIARWHRMHGEPVHFVMGMDEHAQKVLQAAEHAGTTPQAWVDRMSDRFEGTWRALGCSHDDWMRTTQPRHIRGVDALITRIRERHPDAFYDGEYEGLYCIGCEEFKSDSQVVGGRCIEHPSRELVPTRERNTFFRLSAWRDAVREVIGAGTLVVAPDTRRNEILRVLDDGLIDISVSRSRLPWGIPFPDAPDQTVYVWFEALMNYLTATGFPDAGWDRIWPADVHVIGKGITRFHCCIWPAILLAAGIPLPRSVWAHGYVQWDGTKVSKSEGVAVSLDDVIARHGPDALRYFLLREIGFAGDGDFSFDRFDAVYTSELADGIGNLASRVLAMIEKYRGGVVPGVPVGYVDDNDALVAKYAEAMDATDFRTALRQVVDLTTAANGYITASAPWTLTKTNDPQLDTVLGALTRSLVRIAVMSAPHARKAADLWVPRSAPPAALGAARDRRLPGSGQEAGESLSEAGGEPSRLPSAVSLQNCQRPTPERAWRPLDHFRRLTANDRRPELELHLRRIRRIGCRHLEIFPRLAEAEHLGGQVGRESTDLAVELLDRGVVVGTRHGDPVLRALQLILELREVRAALEVRVGFHRRQEARKRCRHRGIGLTHLFERSGSNRCVEFRAGLGHADEHRRFLPRDALDRLDEVADQVSTALQLHLDLPFGLVDLFVQSLESVVSASAGQRSQAKDQGERTK